MNPPRKNLSICDFSNSLVSLKLNLANRLYKKGFVLSKLLLSLLPQWLGLHQAAVRLEDFTPMAVSWRQNIQNPQIPLGKVISMKVMSGAGDGMVDAFFINTIIDIALAKEVVGAHQLFYAVHRGVRSG